MFSELCILYWLRVGSDRPSNTTGVEKTVAEITGLAFQIGYSKFNIPEPHILGISENHVLLLGAPLSFIIRKNGLLNFYEAVVGFAKSQLSPAALHLGLHPRQCFCWKNR